MEKHKGHEEMHAEMTIIFFMIMIIVQIVLVLWKNKHPKSYHASLTINLGADKKLINYLLECNVSWIVAHSIYFCRQFGVVENDERVDPL